LVPDDTQLSVYDGSTNENTRAIDAPQSPLASISEKTLEHLADEKPPESVQDLPESETAQNGSIHAEPGAEICSAEYIMSRKHCAEWDSTPGQTIYTSLMNCIVHGYKQVHIDAAVTDTVRKMLHGTCSIELEHTQFKYWHVFMLYFKMRHPDPGAIVIPYGLDDHVLMNALLATLSIEDALDIARIVVHHNHNWVEIVKQMMRQTQHLSVTEIDASTMLWYHETGFFPDDVNARAMFRSWQTQTCIALPSSVDSACMRRLNVKFEPYYCY
jgi:hypothetical protein